jgi:hypothetical protein
MILFIGDAINRVSTNEKGKMCIFARTKINMPKLYELFWSFFKIGTFTIGGGYAMIPLMERRLLTGGIG